jgi:Type IX secretion system protein PorV
VAPAQKQYLQGGGSLMKTQVGRVAVGAVMFTSLLMLGQQTSLSQGESAVPFLLISPNSRSSGIGESGTGSADDASAIFWNPAGLAFLKGQEISITHANWLPQFHQSDLFYDYLNYREDIEDIGGTIGASITYLNLGEFIRTGPGGPEEIGRFKAFEFAVTGGYATKVLDDLGVGINLRYIQSSLSPIGTDQEQGAGIARTVSFDIAAMYKPTSLPLLGDIGNSFSVGVNLSNIGPKVTYIDAAQADPLPTNLRLGFGVKLLQDEYNEMTYSLDFSRLLVRRRPEIVDPNDSTIIVQPASVDPVYKAIFSAWGDGSGLRKVNASMGVEYWYGSPRLIALRVGHFFEDPSFGNRNFWTFGAGIRYDIYGFDFSYISAAENHPLSDTIRFSLLIGWGGIPN